MSQTRDQKRFTVSEVAADWHELMILQRTMRPSIGRVSEQLDPRFAASRHTITRLEAWFRRVLRHPARKRSGDILHPWTDTGEITRNRSGRITKDVTTDRC